MLNLSPAVVTISGFKPDGPAAFPFFMLLTESLTILQSIKQSTMLTVPA